MTETSSEADTLCLSRILRIFSASLALKTYGYHLPGTLQTLLLLIVYQSLKWSGA